MLLTVQSSLRLIAVAAFALDSGGLSFGGVVPPQQALGASKPEAAPPASPPATNGQSVKSASTTTESARRPGIGMGLMTVLTPIQGVALDQYCNRVEQEIATAWMVVTLNASPPLPAVNREMSVKFWITPDGHIEDPSVVDSTGIAAMDQSVLKALHDSSPVDPLPTAADSQRIQFQVVFDYHLLAVPGAEPNHLLCESDKPWHITGPPLDALDVVALLANSSDRASSRVLLCSRGINFQPDGGFEKTLGHYQHSMEWVGFVSAMKPKIVVAPSPDRAQAFGALAYDPTLRDHAPNAPDAELFAKALDIAPDSAGLQLVAARRETSKKNYAAAEALYRKVTEIWPDCAEAHLGIATMAVVQRRFTDSVGPAREAVKIAPQDLNAQFILANSLMATLQLKDAVAPFKAAQPLGAQVPIVFLNYAETLLHLGEFADAVEPLQKYLQIKNNDAQAHYCLGVAYRGLGKKDEAIAQFDKAGLLAPTNLLYAFVSSQLKAAPGTVSGPSAETQAKLREGASFTGGVYTNRFFGFSYALPADWHVLDPAACAQFTNTLVATYSKNDPLIQDMTAVGLSTATPLFCAVRDETPDLGAPTAIRVNALDSSNMPEQLHAESSMKLLTAGLNAANKLAGGEGVVPHEIEIDGRKFWVAESDRAIANSALQLFMAATEINGYLVTFDLDAADAGTLSALKKQLESIKFTVTPAADAPATAAPPSN